MTRATSDVLAAPPLRHLLYEGFPLEAVLARVHDEHGADATIVAAERVRRGGIGGFFAREVFQVTVEVDPAREVAAGHEAERPTPEIAVLDDSAAAIGAAADDRFGADEFGDGFGDDEIDPEDIAGALALGEPTDRDGADDEMWALLAAAATRVPEPAAVDAPVGQPAALVPDADLALPVPAFPTSPVLVALPPSAEVADHAARAARSGASVVPAVRGAADLAALIARFEPYWRAPRLPAAGVIAVVGARAEALRVAGALAAAIGVRPDDVVVASPAADLVIPTTEEALHLAASTRRRCAPLAVIVVEVVPGRQGHEWARVVLDGLRAEQVRLAVDTAAFVAHPHLGIAALGGVDVVDLVAAADVPDPAAALVIDTPIGTIDGRAATPEMWAATVLAAPDFAPCHQPIRELGSVVS